MRVLLVTPSYHPIVGGVERLAPFLSTRLNELGIQTDVMTFNMNKKWNPIWREEIENNGLFRVFKVPAFNPFSALPINPLYPLLRMNVIPKPSFTRKLEAYDIIHFLGEGDLSFPLFSYFTRKPKIIHCLGTWVTHKHYKKHRLLGNIFKLLFPRLANLYIITRPIEIRLFSDIGIPHKLTFKILPCGVDTDTFQPDRTKKLDNLILFVGRIERVKGLHVLLGALSHLKIPTHLVIIGPRWDVKYVEELEQMSHKINEKGIHKVEYLGAIRGSGLVHWYQKAAVLVCPYLVESSSFVTLEALACGTPVIGTGNHVIKDGVNGLIVPPNDPKKLSNALKKLLEDKELREKYGIEGRRIVERHFSWESTIKKLIEVYEVILNNHKRH